MSNADVLKAKEMITFYDKILPATTGVGLGAAFVLHRYATTQEPSLESFTLNLASISVGAGAFAYLMSLGDRETGPAYKIGMASALAVPLLAGIGYFALGFNNAAQPQPEPVPRTMVLQGPSCQNAAVVDGQRLILPPGCTIKPH